MERLGTVKHLRRYPVKSMMGEELEAAELSQHGIAGDRVYAFIDEQSPNPKRPWMTARQASGMLLFKPRFTSASQLEIEAPGGKKFAISDHETFVEFIREKYSYNVLLRYDAAGCKDSKPLSLLGMRTLESLSSETGLPLSLERFRANIYAEWDNHAPFFEDTLIGKKLSIGGGGAAIKVVKKDSRCIIPTFDPHTAEPSPIVLETIQKNHQGCVGVYAQIETPGPLRVGDEICFLL